MSFVNRVIRRVLQAVPVMFGLSVLVFTITRVIPGDPVRLALGANADPKRVEQVRESMGLNDPIYVQYINWLQGVFTGDWGRSLRTNNNVYHDIATRLPATFELIFVALTFAIILGIPLGVIAGTKQNKWQDHTSRFIALFGVSMPRFWIAILLQIIVVGQLGILPLTDRLSDNVTPPPTITGFYLVDSIVTGQWATFVDAAQHIILPGISLGVATLAVIMRLIRSEMIEENREEYILAARSYGLPTTIIKYKYMLKNAFSSSLTVLGLAFGGLIGSAFLVELVFAWPGIARYGARAILFKDFNAIIGVTIVTGAVFITANLCVDLLYSYLDPRIRSDGQ